MNKEQIEFIYAELKKHEAPFRIYPNPIRNDGVFIGQEKPLEPYPNAKDMFGKAIYPAVPFRGYCFPFQVPQAVAKVILQRLNEKAYNA